MADDPQVFNDILERFGLLDDIYDSMRSNDMSDVVVTSLNALKRIGGLLCQDKETKCNEKSENFRKLGNEAYKNGEYQIALQLYNKALSYAPNNSQSMLLAYSNRSALSFEMKAYKACLNDIETCFTMNCTPDLLKKLNKRKNEASQLVLLDNIAEQAYSDFSKKYFQLNVKRNAQIPCASTDVSVVIESNTPKIVAANDIKVGTVLALETPFVSGDLGNKYSSCFYCHKMSFNLIPCEGCCTAMFCDETCRDTCLIEYHNIECHIIDVIDKITNVKIDKFEVVIKFVLKMMNMCKSWSELISASNNLDTDRIKNCSINDIFDQKNQFSVLNYKKEKHFIHGAMYNESFRIAVIIYHLSNIPSYFPESPADKEAAIRALAGIMMFLTLFTTYIPIMKAITLRSNNVCTYSCIPAHGWFPLASKLNNSCQPNVIIAGLNKRIALVALQPIQRGDELTISYLGFSKETEYDRRPMLKILFSIYGVVCSCSMCKGDKPDSKLNNYKLTVEQKKYLHSINLKEMLSRFSDRAVPDLFPKVCKAMTFLNELSHPDEYLQAYGVFHFCLLSMQTDATRNEIWSDIYRYISDLQKLKLLMSK